MTNSKEVSPSDMSHTKLNLGLINLQNTTQGYGVKPWLCSRRQEQGRKEDGAFPS